MDKFNLPFDINISSEQLLINLAVGTIIALILKWHYIRYGQSLNNRRAFSNIFMLLILTTILIITVIKTSLALSLGLVGALSIVRFRTPIKNPEELAYLFFVIAIGLGLGANQTIPTIIASIVIMAISAVIKEFSKDKIENDIFLSIDFPGRIDDKEFMDNLQNTLKKHTHEIELKRLDSGKELSTAVLLVQSKGLTDIGSMISEIKQMYGGMAVTMIDQNQLPSF